MSPSRQIGVVGMIVGGSALVIGILTFAVPLFLMVITMSSPRHMMHFDAHPGPLIGSMMAWMIGGPIGAILVFFGIPTLLVSVIIYFDARRKERRRT